MDALVLAGGIPKPGDPLYAQTQGKPRALLDVAGLPLAQWVLNALSEAHRGDRVVVVGLDSDSGLTCEHPLAFQPGHGDILENLRAGVGKVLELNPEASCVLCVSSDIPAITGEIVDWIVQSALGRRTMRTTA